MLLSTHPPTHSRLSSSTASHVRRGRCCWSAAIWVSRADSDTVSPSFRRPLRARVGYTRCVSLFASRDLPCERHLLPGRIHRDIPHHFHPGLPAWWRERAVYLGSDGSGTAW